MNFGNLKFMDFVKVTNEVIEEEIEENVKKIEFRKEIEIRSYMVRVEIIGKKVFVYNLYPSYDYIEEDFYLTFLNEVKEQFRACLLHEIESEFNGGLKRND